VGITVSKEPTSIYRDRQTAGWHHLRAMAVTQAGPWPGNWDVTVGRDHDLQTSLGATTLADSYLPSSATTAAAAAEAAASSKHKQVM